MAARRSTVSGLRAHLLRNPIFPRTVKEQFWRLARPPLEITTAVVKQDRRDAATKLARCRHYGIVKSPKVCAASQVATNEQEPNYSTDDETLPADRPAGAGRGQMASVAGGDDSRVVVARAGGRLPPIGSEFMSERDAMRIGHRKGRHRLRAFVISETLAPFQPDVVRTASKTMELHPRWAWGFVHDGHDARGRNEVEITRRAMDSAACETVARETQGIARARDGCAANAGACTGTELCVSATLSWRSPERRCREIQPRAGFVKLFGDTAARSVGAGSADAAAQEHSRLGVGKTAAIRRNWSPRTRGGTNTRSRFGRERRIKSRGAVTSSCRRWTSRRRPPIFEDHLALMMDLQLLAFRSDLTRVISFMIGKEQSARPYPQIGVPEAHHPLSHHGDNPELIAYMSKINRYHTELFSQYLAKLRATPDGDGTLLAHMTICMDRASPPATGTRRQLAADGHRAGERNAEGRRHLVYADKPSMANLLVTLMDKLNLPVGRSAAAPAGSRLIRFLACSEMSRNQNQPQRSQRTQRKISRMLCDLCAVPR